MKVNFLGISKIKPVGCFKRWGNFGKMWVRRLRAPQRRSNVHARTAAFTVDKRFRQIDKNSSDEMTKNILLAKI